MYLEHKRSTQNKKIGGIKMKRISVDNGNTFISPKEAIEKAGFEEIESFMDEDLMEKVHSLEFEGDQEFLEKYLELSDHDLIIG